MNPEVLILCGLPCSGKSTFCSWFPQHIKLSSDKYIEELAKENNTTYNEIFKDSIKDANKKFFQDVFKAANSNNNVIIDRKNLTIRSRNKFIKIFKKHTPVIVYFDVSLDTIFSRNIREGKIISKVTLDQMFQTLQVPTPSEATFVTVGQLTLKAPIMKLL